jgi:ACR3 family arsenite efflux pump ArsB
MDQGTAWKNVTERKANLGWIEKLLALWIGLCIVIGLALGKISPGPE